MRKEQAQKEIEIEAAYKAFLQRHPWFKGADREKIEQMMGVEKQVMDWEQSVRDNPPRRVF